MKYLLTLCVLFILSGCVKPYLEYDDSKLTITNNSKSFDITILNSKVYKSNYAVFNSFILTEKDFHLEYIKLKSQYSWTGLADGLYQDFLQENIKNLKRVSHQIVDNADIFLYTKDNKYFYLITLYDASSNTFIVDYTGDITSNILNEDKHIQKIEQFKTVFDKSILDNDIIAHYFEKKNSKNEYEVIP